MRNLDSQGNYFSSRVINFVDCIGCSVNGFLSVEDARIDFRWSIKEYYIAQLI